MVVKMLIMVFWVVILCGLVGGYHRSSMNNVNNSNIYKSGHLECVSFVSTDLGPYYLLGNW
jgi:hypothetical protein